MNSSLSRKIDPKTGELGQFPPVEQEIMQFQHGSPMLNKTSKVPRKDIGDCVPTLGNGAIPSNRHEELYQLLAVSSTTPQPFAMIIRFNPDIIEEIKQAEVDGITSMMKFGTHASGHVSSYSNFQCQFSYCTYIGMNDLNTHCTYRWLNVCISFHLFIFLSFFYGFIYD